MKIDRLIGILMILINKRKVTAKYLSDHFEVSVRTIQRDMDTLTLAGVPLYADVGVNGGYQLLEDYRFEKGFLNKSEGDVLIAFLESLEHTAPYSEVKSIFNKFASITDQSNANNKLVVKLNPNDTDQVFNKSLTDIVTARDKQQKIAITYYNAHFKNSTRVICPYTLALLGDTWYLYGYCQLKNDFRLFKVSRIVSSEVMAENFELQPLPDKLPWETQMDSGREPVKITLEIDIKLLGNLPGYFSPENCIVEEDVIKAELNFPVDEWVYAILMGLTPFVKVIGPDFVKLEYQTRLKAALKKNC